jgi:hypothetical protein
MVRAKILLSLTLASVLTPVPSSAEGELLARCEQQLQQVEPLGYQLGQFHTACTTYFDIPGDPSTDPSGWTEVVTRLEPVSPFVGEISLRVRGPDALWTDYFGYFTNDVLVYGEQTRSFLMKPGRWQLEVYISSRVRTSGYIGVWFGTIGGSVSSA